jgi:outer membrane receptor protein involved in Fe transport
MAMPEHTYAFGLAYVHGGSRISYNVQGQGSWQSSGYDFWVRTGNQYATRLQNYNSRVTIPDPFTEIRPGYLLGDLNVSQQLTSHVEALVQINNVTNSYQSELDPTILQSGRTTGLGFRLHL